MLDKLPLSVSQVVVAEWLPLVSIVRLDTACAGCVNRREWLEMLNGMPILATFVTTSRSALAAMRWLSSRQMKFSRHVIQVTKRNKVQRAACLSAVHDSVFHLALEQIHDPIRTTGARSHQKKRWKIMSRLRNLFQPTTDNTMELQSIEYELPAEDNYEVYPTLFLPNLKVLLVDGNCFNHSQWLPIAPELLQLHADRVAVNSTALEAITTLYPKLQHLTLSLVYHVDQDAVQSFAAQACPQLQSLRVVNRFVNSSMSQVTRHLFPNCWQHLHFLALDGLSVNDAVCERIAAHCPQLLGIDIGEGHQMTEVGLLSLAASCTSLRSLGLSFSGSFEPALKFALDEWITANASTLQKIALIISGRATVHAAQLDLTMAVAECPQLRSLHVGIPNFATATGVVRVLQQCKHMKQLSLPWQANEPSTSWKLGFKALIAMHYPHIAVQCLAQRQIPIWASDTGWQGKPSQQILP